LGSRAFRHSSLGYGGCFADRSLIDGAFHQLFVAPLIERPRALEGELRRLRGIQWPVVDRLDEVQARIAAPVKLIWGAEDPTFPLECVRRLAFPLRGPVAA